jgi:hypothetical protein
MTPLVPTVPLGKIKVRFASGKANDKVAEHPPGWHYQHQNLEVYTVYRVSRKHKEDLESNESCPKTRL